MTGNTNANWVFTSIAFDKYQSYLSEIIGDTSPYGRIFNPNHYDFSRLFTDETIINKAGSNYEFIESCDIKWLEKFYKWIGETQQRKKYCQTKSIFIDAEGKAVAAYDQFGNRHPDS